MERVLWPFPPFHFLCKSVPAFLALNGETRRFRSVYSGLAFDGDIDMDAYVVLLVLDSRSVATPPKPEYRFIVVRPERATRSYRS